MKILTKDELNYTQFCATFILGATSYELRINGKIRRKNRSTTISQVSGKRKKRLTPHGLGPLAWRDVDGLLEMGRGPHGRWWPAWPGSPDPIWIEAEHAGGGELRRACRD